MDGAFESIRYFHDQCYQFGIVTGAGKDVVNTTLEEHKLAKYVSVVASGDDVIHSKPAQECYLLAAENLGLQPS